MTPVQRALRTVLQLIAAGGLTALVNTLAGGLSPSVAALILMAWGVVVSFAQNYLEDKGAVPAILKDSAP